MLEIKQKHSVSQKMCSLLSKRFALLAAHAILVELSLDETQGAAAAAPHLEPGWAETGVTAGAGGSVNAELGEGCLLESGREARPDVLDAAAQGAGEALGCAQGFAHLELC